MAHLLLVEDERNVALALRAELVAEGYTVDIVGDGETAVERVRREKFDLILLDLGLPKKDGYVVCQELRHERIRTPILILTAKDREADLVMGLNLGADDYVVKPFSAIALRARIHALLRRALPDNPEAYCFGDIEIEFASAQVRLSGNPVKLTALEFKILTTFIHKRSRILTREQLIEDAWPFDCNPTDRVVDQHIMNLRRKIETDPQRPRYIVNVRGLGYRFEG